MFQKDELARLRAQKELLLLNSSTNRLLLLIELQRLKAPRNWGDEFGGMLRQRPLVTAALAALAGVVTMKAFRRREPLGHGFGRWLRVGSMAFTAWKLFRRQSSE